MSLALLLIASTALAAEPRKRALLVGVSTYQKAGLADKPLPFAAPDMQLLAAELKAAGWEPTLLTSVGAKSNASRAEIVAALGETLKDLNADDLVLVALSGHGQQFEADVNGMRHEEAFFCPADAKPGEAETLLGMTELTQKLGKHGGRNLILIDACRDDPRRGGKGVDGDSVRSLPGSVSILFSCSARQQSFETNQMYGKDSVKGHGVFFHRVLKGLRGEAKNARDEVTWARLAEYVTENVNDDAVTWFPERAVATAGGEKLVQVPRLVGTLAGKSPVLRRASLTAAPPSLPNPNDNPTSISLGQPKPGEERAFEIAPGVKMIFCWIPPGDAQLGSPKAERDEVLKQIKADKEPEWLASEAEGIRGKYRSKGFWLGKYEVTQQEWAALMDGKTPSKFKGDRLPVEQISWDDCQELLTNINSKSGSKSAFGAAGKFVLPHENEWEYACRGGRVNGRAFYFGDALDGKQANCNGNYPFGTENKGDYVEKTTEVGSYATKAAHPWGLCDMHGNVWEWCENLYSSEQKNRALRGGSWNSGAWRCRAASRSRYAPGDRGVGIGLRVCFRLD